MTISKLQFGASVSFNQLPREVNSEVIKVISERMTDRSSMLAASSGTTVHAADGSDLFVVGPEAQVVATIKAHPISVILAMTQRGIPKLDALRAINQGVSSMLGREVKLFPVSEALLQPPV